MHCGRQEPPTGHVEAVQVLLRGQGEQQPWNTPSEHVFPLLRVNTERKRPKTLQRGGNFQKFVLKLEVCGVGG